MLFNTLGGITYDETIDLVQSIAGKGKIVDINGYTVSNIAQLMLNFIGAIAHSDQI